MESHEKFGAARAAEYREQSQIALAGYEACHELTACLLSAVLGEGSRARVLVVGAGGPALEIITAGRLEPAWEFVAVDPSEPMLAIARESLSSAGLSDRTTFHQGDVDGLDAAESFEGAVMFGVFHHVSGDDKKKALLNSIAKRLKPGAPLVLSGNRYRYSEKPVFLKAWANRWRQKGWPQDVVAAKLATIVQGAEPPNSDEAVEAFLEEAGFTGAIRFFSSLFWSSWMAFRTGL